jgi:hypothetical protein
MTVFVVKSLLRGHPRRRTLKTKYSKAFDQSGVTMALKPLQGLKPVLRAAA